MPTYVAFLRAINLGPRRRFGKDDVAMVTAGAGFVDVATYLNTGNVLLRSPMRSSARVEAALERAYLADRGFEVPTMVRTLDELRSIAAEASELGAGHVGERFVSLLKDELTASASADLEASGGEGTRVVVRGRSVHILVDEHARTDRPGSAGVERLLGVATNRNARVIATLAARWG